ncbi:MAG: hypothetical protein E6J85_18075 [Deltaproteobacteria bacterium]|nr:MAG: hypothetical protein E6J85_18075 [Deltaproteobacteria bacterium]
MRGSSSTDRMRARRTGGAGKLTRLGDCAPLDPMGSSTAKVVPLPGTLSTEMVPPIDSTIWRQM